MCSYSSLAEAINSLLVFTQQPLLPPLDIFGCFCDQEAGRRMSDRGRMSIKSSGSPPTLPYSYTLNSSSTNMWTSVDCFVFFTVAWLCCLLTFLFSVWSAGRNHRIIAAQKVACSSILVDNKTMQTLQINNRYLEMTLVLTNGSSGNVTTVILVPQGSFEGWVVQ